MKTHKESDFSLEQEAQLDCSAEEEECMLI